MSEAELKALHIKRGMVKGRLTRFVTFLSTPGNKRKPELIQSRLNELRPCLREFEDIHTQIKIIDDQESDDELFQFEKTFTRLSVKPKVRSRPSRKSQPRVRDLHLHVPSR
jgi:hypothetical protein